MEIWTGDFINIIHKIYILKIFLTRTYKTHFYERIIEKTCIVHSVVTYEKIETD